MDVRKMTPADEAAYLDILARTSDDDRYYRFFHTVTRFERRDIARFVEARSDTIGVIAEQDGRPLGTAHAFLTKDVAEIAIVVASDSRRRGVARALLARLVAMLQARRVSTLVAYSLNENVGFVNLARSLGMRASRTPGDGSVLTWTLAIGTQAKVVVTPLDLRGFAS
ncbi:MAG: hypothetical protein NVS3B17_04480 [Vulcanimicrobiaceae bacterium]